MRKPTRPVITITRPPPKTITYNKRLCKLVGTYKSWEQAVRKAMALWRRRRVAIIRKWFGTAWRVYDCGPWIRPMPITVSSAAKAERRFKAMAKK